MKPFADASGLVLPTPERLHRFRRNWPEGEADPKEPFLGSGDIQSLADLANSFAVAHEVRLVPFGKKVAFGLAIVTMLFPFSSPNEARVVP